MFSRNLMLTTACMALIACLHGVVLVAEDATGVKGTVIDRVEHAAIRNVYILAHSRGGNDRAVRTDGSGRYAIELSPNIYDVFISASGFDPICRKIEVRRGSMVVFDAVLDASKVGMQENSSSSQAAPQGIARDIPGGLPPDGTNANSGILSSEPLVPSAASLKAVRVSQQVMRKFLITKMVPTYPSEAARQHVDGTVFLHIDIDKSGNVSSADLVSGHPLLSPAAIDAVKQWKYKP